MSPGRTVERLARKLSRHNLQQLGQVALPSPTSLSSAPGLLDPRELSSFQSWRRSEPVTQPQQHYPPVPSHEHLAPWTPGWSQAVGEPIEVDEAYLAPPDDKAPDEKPPRRQPSRQLRAAESRLEDMIASGTQCNVRGPPRPVSTAASSTPSAISTAQPSFIEADSDFSMPIPDLEVDDADADSLSVLANDDISFSEGGMPLRYASGPGGIRKYSVGGVALRYRLSADAALRCANVVRSRPRMRKRHKTRHGSTASSGTTSAVVSPATSPSARSPPFPPSYPSRR